MKNEYVADGELAMRRGSVLRIEDGEGLLIQVWDGELWLTEEGDRRDRFIGAGRTFRLEANGVAIAQALRDSTVMLSATRRVAVSRSRASLGARIYALWTLLFAPYARTRTASL
jgi:hypothetical protein